MNLNSIKLLFLLLFTSEAFAFTVASNPPRKFSTNNVTVNVAENSCAAGSFTTAQLLDWVEEAMDDYWNTVHTSALVLKKGEVLASTDLSTVTNDSTFGTKLATVEIGTILVGCNASYFSSSSTLAVGAITMNSQGKAKGMVLVNTAADYLTDHTQAIATLAHEIGHALGLGHSSNDYALMYYNASAATNEYLSEDDKDGITYLYPQEEVASCGSIALVGSGNDNDLNGPMNFTFGFMLIMMLLSLVEKLKYRFKKIIIAIN